MVDLRNEKLNLHLSQCMVLLYGLSYLLAMSVAILLYTTVAVAPMPPEVEDTSGEEDPYALFLSHVHHGLSSSLIHSCDNTGLGRCSDKLRAKGLKTLTSKKCTLPVIPPKALCHNIQSGTILSTGSPMGQLFTSHRL